MNKKIEDREPESSDWKLKVHGYFLRKLRDDALWNRLTPGQRERLEKWLFEENLGYAKTTARVKEEFGIETAITSVSRCYHRLAREREVADLLEAQLTANELNGLPVDTGSLRTAAIRLTSKAALKMVVEKPEEVKTLASITKLLLESERNELRRGRLEFAQRCFDYDATVASVDDLPKVRAYMQAIEDDNSLSNDEKIRKVQAMLFHWSSLVKARKVPIKPNHGK
jgi:hypothetical protein